MAQREVAGLQVQADAVVEGEALAAGVGHCVARPGGPQQLLVLQPHAVVQPHSTSATATKTPLGIFPPAPMRRSPGHTLMLCGLFCVLHLSHPFWVSPKSMWMTSSSRSFEPSGARRGSPLRSRPCACCG